MTDIREGIRAYKWRIDKLREFLVEPKTLEDVHKWINQQVDSSFLQPVQAEPYSGESIILGTLHGGEADKWFHLMGLLKEVGDVSVYDGMVEWVQE
jgi:hypothetical protein